MPAHPDPTFHASAKLAMQAPPEKLAYTVMLSPDLYQEIWAVGEWAMAAEKFADIGPARERGGRCPQIGASPSPRPPNRISSNGVWVRWTGQLAICLALYGWPAVR
jgi:hypothetical protein